MTDTRVQLLQDAITWRSVSDSDLAVCAQSPSSASNGDAIFVRNAVKMLFNYYYAQKDDQEVAHFAQLIDDFMSRDTYCCLFYGREFRKTLTFLQRTGETARARGMLEGYLLSLGVLSSDGTALSLGRFPIGGNYSSSWAVIFFDAYTRLLVKEGDGAMATALLADSVNMGGLLDDAVIMLQRTLDGIYGTATSAKFPTVTLKKSSLDPRYLSEATIELTALAYLKDELKREGVFAEVDVWRLMSAVIHGELSASALHTAYGQLTGAALPATFYDFLLANGNVLRAAFAAQIGATFGAVGFPDLVLYQEHNLRDLLLVEVKDVRDRLRPHQEALLGRFTQLGLPCEVLQFTP